VSCSPTGAHRPPGRRPGRREESPTKSKAKTASSPCQEGQAALRRAAKKPQGTGTLIAVSQKDPADLASAGVFLFVTVSWQTISNTAKRTTAAQRHREEPRNRHADSEIYFSLRIRTLVRISLDPAAWSMSCPCGGVRPRGGHGLDAADRGREEPGPPMSGCADWHLNPTAAQGVGIVRERVLRLTCRWQ